jgi:hypothetical protein
MTMMMILCFMICWLCLSVRCALHEVTMLTLVSQGDARKNPFRLLFSARWLTFLSHGFGTNRYVLGLG